MAERMRVQIFYCDRCGLRVPEEDLKGGRAQEQEGKVTCTKCLEGQSGLKKMVRRATTSVRLLAHIPGKPASGASSAPAKPLPHLVSESHSKSNTQSSWLLISSVLGALGLLGVLIAFSMPDPVREQKRSSLPSSTPRSAGPASASQPSAKRHSGPTTPRPPAVEPLPPMLQRSTPESRGRDAFERVIRFEGLEPGDLAGRRARLEAFLLEHSNTIVAGRALVMLSEMQRGAPATPSEPALPVEIPAAPVTPVAVAPEIAPTAAPVVVAPIAPPVAAVTQAPPAAAPSRGSEEALNAYRVAFLDLLRAYQPAAAANRLAEAEKDPALSTFQAELALDRKALLWLEEIHGAVPAGLEKLKEVETFALVLVRGDPLHVGREAPYQVTEVKEAAITLTRRGLSMPVALDKLTPETLAELGALGLGTDGRGQLKQAFAVLLGSAASARSSADLAKTLPRAQAAGAAAEEVAYVLRLAQLLEKERREAAAAAAWKLLLQVADGKRLVEGVENFQRTHAGTVFALGKEKELAALLSKAKQRPLGESLVGFWTFDEGKGTAVSDSSGRGHHGKLTGTPKWMEGRSGGALLFNGQLDGVKIKNSPDFLLADGGAITAWIKPSGKPCEIGRIVQKGEGKQNEGFLLALGTDEDRLYAAIQFQKPSGYFTPKGSLSANVWSHAALVFTKDTRDVFIDGVKQSLSEDNNRSEYPADDFLRIGLQAENKREFLGSIDEVGIYNRPLSEEEVKALAKAPARRP